MTLLFKQTSPFSNYFLPLGYKYSLQHPVVRNYYFLVTRYPTFNVIYNRGQNWVLKINSQGDPHSESYGRVQAFILSEILVFCDVMLSRWVSGYRPTFHLIGARGPRCLNLFTREDLHLHESRTIRPATQRHIPKTGILNYAVVKTLKPSFIVSADVLQC